MRANLIRYAINLTPTEQVSCMSKDSLSRRV